ncbi:hypothetical protein HAX54_023682, partial [Datura stramonium]|nr:hypothetical protein [Datura stramonium]
MEGGQKFQEEDLTIGKKCISQLEDANKMKNIDVLQGVAPQKLTQITRQAIGIQTKVGVNPAGRKSWVDMAEEGIDSIDMTRPDTEINKETIDKVPIWIKLVGLDIKYWGRITLTKIASLVGNLIKADRATTTKKRMTFTRILVEIPLHQEYPKERVFENEYEKILEQK